MYLEGEQSPWKDRTSCHWQRWSDVTDSSVEESLEADVPQLTLAWRQVTSDCVRLTYRFDALAHCSAGCVGTHFGGSEPIRVGEVSTALRYRRCT